VPEESSFFHSRRNDWAKLKQILNLIMDQNLKLVRGPSSVRADYECTTVSLS